MDTFTYHNPTRLVFGKGTLEKLKEEIPSHAKRILIVYGGGSIKRSGLYEQILSILKEMDREVFELAGVEPNPRLTTVKRGADLCRKEEIDFILAVGGGSVIDCTKAIAVGARYEGDIWEIITRKATTDKALPFGTVLTLAATGSEMNAGSVITNWDTQEKVGWGLPVTYPLFSILDPVNTFTVPLNQTIYGIVDMMSHVLEQYFTHSPNTPMLDRFCESILNTVIETAPHMVKDLENYELRETLLYAGTMALNGTLSMGMLGDWSTHRIEHAVSAVYDIPHGGGLAILFPHWIRYTIDADPSRAAKLAVRVFGVDPAGKSDREVGLEGVDRLREFWSSIGAPSRLADYDIDDAKLDLMVEKALLSEKEFGRFQKLSKDDVRAILQAAL
ncbi:iron-containing alcohol dehydrogenase [Marininema halotolerans]|uniref:Uncharacterized protein n=1 Tax=Marininema halotolerans TaxID=1155944 RepID=A0A1I6SJH7_9BACL|nr:iron-containing alcohol dehydrogenase [Marininema halotolerans]SFS77097.1 hypothetical protein SAMN05444972_107142 [Marininema halotolerans]